tara:strand:+ start:1280 stop:2134 length:855 start_codon:yes stop_codon:yes gene_type:complete
MTNKFYLSDNLVALKSIPDNSVDLVYTDPPFNTGKKRVRQNKKAVQSSTGTQTGFQDKKYKVTSVSEALSYDDSFSDFESFIAPRIAEIHRVLKPTGSFYLHLDYRESPYARILGDFIFGRENFLNEIIWAYDYGGKPKTRWPAKHDNILFWVKDKSKYYWNDEEVARIPYMAPGMVSKEKAERGKKVTSCWWHTIVSPTGKEKTGYPTQKPLGIIERIIKASSPPSGVILDPFAGSGSTGEAAVRLGREFILVDKNPESLKVTQERLAKYESGLPAPVEYHTL